MRLYARYDFGRLLRLNVLDDRQYRTHQACPKPNRGGGNIVKQCAERTVDARTMLGLEQEQWLSHGIETSSAQWNIIAQQTLMAQAAGRADRFWTDGWDGYPAARRRLLWELVRHEASNPLVISGDIHASAVCDLKLDFNQARSQVVATEFCGTSITSQGRSQNQARELRANNEHIKHLQGDKRGYTVMALDENKTQATIRVLDNEKNPNSELSTLDSFIVESRRPGANKI